MGEQEGDSVEDHINKACLSMTNDVLQLATRTALGGLTVTVFLRFRLLLWLQGIVSFGMCGLGLMSNMEHLEAKTLAGGDFSALDRLRLTSKLVGQHLFAAFVTGWISHRTHLGTRLSLAWLYEAGIIFVVAGCYQDARSHGSRAVLAAQAFGCLIAARVLDGRFWRWLLLFAVEVGYSF